MAQFFFAYEAHTTSGSVNKGFRVFESDAVTSDEVVDLINLKLDEIADTFFISRSRVIAVAFNRI